MEAASRSLKTPVPDRWTPPDLAVSRSTEEHFNRIQVHKWRVMHFSCNNSGSLFAPYLPSKWFPACDKSHAVLLH